MMMMIFNETVFGQVKKLYSTENHTLVHLCPTSRLRSTSRLLPGQPRAVGKKFFFLQSLLINRPFAWYWLQISFLKQRGSITCIVMFQQRLTMEVSCSHHPRVMINWCSGMLRLRKAVSVMQHNKPVSTNVTF